MSLAVVACLQICKVLWFSSLSCSDYQRDTRSLTIILTMLTGGVVVQAAERGFTSSNYVSISRIISSVRFFAKKIHDRRG